MHEEWFEDIEKRLALLEQKIAKPVLTSPYLITSHNRVTQKELTDPESLEEELISILQNYEQFLEWYTDHYAMSFPQFFENVVLDDGFYLHQVNASVTTDEVDDAVLAVSPLTAGANNFIWDEYSEGKFLHYWRTDFNRDVLWFKFDLTCTYFYAPPDGPIPMFRGRVFIIETNDGDKPHIIGYTELTTKDVDSDYVWNWNITYGGTIYVPLQDNVKFGLYAQIRNKDVFVGGPYTFSLSVAARSIDFHIEEW